MSLFEQYYSDTNRKYIYDMLNDLIKKEYSIDISGNLVFKDFYTKQIKKTFEENNTDNISDINRILINECIKYFSKNFVETDDKKITSSDYSSLLTEREKLLDLNDNDDNNNNNDNDNNDNKTPIENLKEPNVDIKEPIIDIKEPMVNNNIESFEFNSIQRTNIQSSRYNYRVKNKDNIIQYVSKLFIPIENNFLFTIPLLKIKFPDFKKEIILEKKETIKNDNRDFGIYYPIEKINLLNEMNEMNEINLLNKINHDRVRIKITDIGDNEYKENDILSVNIVEIKDNNILFTCSKIFKNDYQPGDFIKIINNRNHNLDELFTYPLKIKRIKNNILVCSMNDYTDYQDVVITNIDMKIINTSNQNIIYFNLI